MPEALAHDTESALPILTLPDTSTLPAAEINPAVIMLPPVTLPLALIKPVTYSPVVANTATFEVPPMPTETLPPELTTVTFDVPLEIFAPPPPPDIPVSKDPLPIK